jgi:hypothetical protein
VAGKQQRDPVTGALLYISLPTITLEFDSFSNWDWGWGNGVTNATSNLLGNCWGALTSKSAWLGKKYHMSSCMAEVGGWLSRCICVLQGIVQQVHHLAILLTDDCMRAT